MEAEGEADVGEASTYLDPKLSRKILQEARAQEVEEESAVRAARASQAAATVAAEEEEDDDEDDGGEGDDEVEGEGEGDEEVEEVTFDYLDGSKITEEDERVLALFAGGGFGDDKPRTLADMIMCVMRPPHPQYRSRRRAHT